MVGVVGISWFKSQCLPDEKSELEQDIRRPRLIQNHQRDHEISSILKKPPQNHYSNGHHHQVGVPLVPQPTGNYNSRHQHNSSDMAALLQTSDTQQADLVTSWQHPGDRQGDAALNGRPHYSSIDGVLRHSHETDF